MKKINFIYFGLFIVASAAFLLFTKPGNQVIGSVIFSMTDMQQNIQKEEQRQLGELVNVDASINVNGLDLQLGDAISKDMVVIPVTKDCQYCEKTLEILANEQGIDVLVIGMDGYQVELPSVLNTNMVIANSPQSPDVFNMPVKYSPTLFFVDAGGQIQRKVIGFRPNIASIIRSS
jgi:hypothetical protein